MEKNWTCFWRYLTFFYSLWALFIEEKWLECQKISLTYQDKKLLICHDKISLIYIWNMESEIIWS